ncbi:MAG: ATP-binding protein [Firmicutes bacterium HGW-Firmicutes-3]|jgi:Mrp family chromosome partitioning ATPase|nr:MAG: ATP-binding protein [Firmicutes bacterium HGW-Firmicutes-3]
MSDQCTDSCSTCSENCGDRVEKQKIHLENPHHHSDIKRVIGIVSGKGGVGKSLVTSMMAVAMNRIGHQTAILDADITGPSIPKAFGLSGKATGNAHGMLPMKSRTGIDIMSVNFLLDKETDPVIWRGPLVANVVKQFWTDVIWTNIDYMFIDMPPGTGDVSLTVFQNIDIDGIIIVTSPQELVSMIVEKAVNMATKMKIPVIGLIENMSYFKCPDNNKTYHIFGESHIEAVAEKHGLKVLGRMGIDPEIAKACDTGNIEDYTNEDISNIAESLEKAFELKGNKNPSIIV